MESPAHPGLRAHHWLLLEREGFCSPSSSSALQAANLQKHLSQGSSCCGAAAHGCIHCMQHCDRHQDGSDGEAKQVTPNQGSCLHRVLLLAGRSESRSLSTGRRVGGVLCSAQGARPQPSSTRSAQHHARRNHPSGPGRAQPVLGCLCPRTAPVRGSPNSSAARNTASLGSHSQSRDLREPLLLNAKRLAATEHRTAGAFLPSPPLLLQLLWKSWLPWQAGAAGTEQGQVAPGERISSSPVPGSSPSCKV